jgi:(p)ppGpp synthase/HD superfamily hydrolase
LPSLDSNLGNAEVEGIGGEEMSSPTIESTIEFIKSAHAGQLDKAGVAYWHHPVSVMKRLGVDAPDDYKLAALLHDVIEDTKYSAADLQALGYNERVVEAVLQLTKLEEIPYLDNIERIAASGNEIAIAVKIADNEDNLDPERLAHLTNARVFNLHVAKYQASLEILRRATAE